MRFLLFFLVVSMLGCAAGPYVGSPAAYADSGSVSYEKRTAGLEAGSSPATDLALQQDAPAQAPAVERQVIYSAALRIVVVSAMDAMRSIQAFAEKAGGHLQESNSRSITIRVPAPKFEATLELIGSLGEIIDRNVKASDVTEEMLDLNIRLDNARKTRERLLDHLAKSDKIENTLKIEAELARVSGEIEQMEGKLRYLQSQIAMSTIRVELNTLTPQTIEASHGLGLPFEWLEHLGDGLVAGNVESQPRKPGIFSGGPKFDPPAEFIRYYSNSDLVEALSADGLRLKVQVQENYDKGTLAFWTKLARKTLVATRMLAVTSERELGKDRALISGTRMVSGKLSGYLLVLARTKDHVLTFEAWGPKEILDLQFEALVASANTLRR